MKKGVIGAILIVVVIVAVLLVTGLFSGILLPKGQPFTVNFTTSPGGSNHTVQFNSTVSGGVAPFRYVWSFGDGNFSTLASPKHIFTPGTYTVELFVLDNVSASASVSKSLTVSA